MTVSKHLLKNRAPQCPFPARLLGVDLGKKTIGLAVSNDMQTVATPLETVKRTKFSQDVMVLAAVLDDYNIQGIVFGYPLHMDGRRSGGCDAVESFVDEMRKHDSVAGRHLWIAFHDERLSTVSVEESVDQFVDKKSAKESGVTDKLAAQVILQGALDYMARQR